MISFYRVKYLIHLFSLVILGLQLIVNAQSLPFKHLSTKDGLSNNYVNNIIQDKSGFLWFTTDDGLNRFDGYYYKIFRNEQSDKNSISDNATISIIEDEDGKIWIGTKNGFIDCYDPVHDKFTRWEIPSSDGKDNPINIITIDKKKNVWMGTYRNGLFRLNTKTGEIKNWRNNVDDKNSLSNNYVSSIVVDDRNVLWIGTFYGLNKFEPEKSENHFTKYFNEKNNKYSLGDNTIWAITRSHIDKNILLIGTANGLTLLDTRTEQLKTISIPNPQNLLFGTGAGTVIEEYADGEKILWINSYAGLVRYNQSRNKFDRYIVNKEDPNSICSNQINNIYKDRSGVIWIATDNGLNYFSSKNIKFNSTFLSSKEYVEVGELNILNIKAIEKTPDGTIWFGTDKGLFYYSSKGEKRIVEKFSSFEYENIWTLAPGNEDELWIGTYGSGLFLLNYKNNSITKKNIVDHLIKSSSKNFIKTLYRDKKERLWVGFWGVGLARLDLLTGEVKNWLSSTTDEHSISYDDVWAIFEDRKSRVWIGTNGGGLNCFDETKENFFRINTDTKYKFSISSNSVYSVAESSRQIPGDNSTVLWVGTGNGLNKIVIDDTSVRSDNLIQIKDINIYTTGDGLIDNSIKSIVEDDNGNLWLGTSSGITLYDVDKNKFTNFSTSDGIIGIDFNFSSSLRISRDLILMGGTSGLNIFNPEKIVQSSYNPQIAISDFQIFNNPVEPGPGSILTKNIFYSDEIILNHNQNVFSFQFSAFDYNSPSSISYSYMMEGFDKNWVNGGSRRFVTYTNLNPGKYTFKVRSTNSDGVWSDNTRSIAITITPPWWQTGWAILLYFVVLVAGIWGIVKFQANRVKLQNELRIREFESYHLREIEQMKSRFFANLSHEFRTPLLLIKGPLESLLNGKIKENVSDYYRLLLRNIEKLQTLIDQLLELSQLEAESIPLKKDSYDLAAVIRSCFNNFNSLAAEKNINYEFKTDAESIFSIFDKDKLEKIINNLLSNAFKFTPGGGTVYVEIKLIKEASTTTTRVTVKDSGIGIPEDAIDKIFNRFYQVDNSSKRNFGGSGIGLSLVKELVSLHNWDINVESTQNVGTEFILTIPLNHSQPHRTDSYHTENKMEQIRDNTDNIQTRVIPSSGKDSEKPVVLFVEDSEDVRTYVCDLLKHDYSVLLAESGEAGIDLTKDNLPDIIISDVMMPGMDGFEFCKRIKSDWKTSHIPVILLTAKVDHQSKLDGLELGADDYITKPFEQQELLIRIKNLIEQRKLLKEKFGKAIISPADSIYGSKENKELIEKASSVVEKYLGDENFNSEILAKEMFMSRSQLTRKMQSAVGQGPGEFIRNYKLNRSAKLILEKKLSITQIALEIGFGSPAQYTRAFHKHFNCLPSDFNHSNIKI